MCDRLSDIAAVELTAVAVKRIDRVTAYGKVNKRKRGVLQTGCRRCTHIYAGYMLSKYKNGHAK